MSDAQLPQPIYPPGGGAGAAGPPSGGGGYGGGYGGPPAGGPGGPAGPGGPGGYGSGPGVPGPKKPAVDPRVLIGAGVAAVVLIVVLVVVLTGGGGGDDDQKAGDTTTAEPSDSTARPGAIGDGPSTTAAPGTEPADPGSDLQDRAEAVAAIQLDSAGPETVSCMADGFAGSPTLLDTIEPMSDAVSFSDPNLANEFARIVVDCATLDELLVEIETLLVASGIMEPDLSCFIGNLSLFGAPQWQDFIATILQPAESSYAEQLFLELSIC